MKSTTYGAVHKLLFFRPVVRRQISVFEVKCIPVRQFCQSTALGAIPALPDDVAVVAEIFGRISEAFNNDEVGAFALNDAVSAYGTALSMENRSVEYYQSMVDSVSDESQKNVLIWIIREEKRHAKIVQGLAEFVRRPKEWLENAEINHHETY